MSKLKYLLPALAVLLVSGFVWLHEHDQRVTWKALAEARADSLEAQDKITEDLWKAIKSMDGAYAQALNKHKRALSRMRDSVATLDKEMDRIVAELGEELPDHLKYKLDTLVTSCANQVSLVMSNLTNCEALRADLERSIVKRDHVALGLIKSRDGYKKLYYESQEPQPSVWSTVGKIETGAGILALLTKLLGLW